MLAWEVTEMWKMPLFIFLPTIMNYIQIYGNSTVQRLKVMQSCKAVAYRLYNNRNSVKSKRFQKFNFYVSTKL